MSEPVELFDFCFFKTRRKSKRFAWFSWSLQDVSHDFLFTRPFENLVNLGSEMMRLIISSFPKPRRGTWYVPFRYVLQHGGIFQFMLLVSCVLKCEVLVIRTHTSGNDTFFILPMVGMRKHRFHKDIVNVRFVLLMCFVNTYCRMDALPRDADGRVTRS